MSVSGQVTTGLRAVFGAARLVLAGLCLGFLAQPARAASQPSNPHVEAVAARADIRAAIAEITKASRIIATDPDLYRKAAQRAIADLGGGTEKEAGAIGHLDWLLHQAGTYRWTAAVQGTFANVTIAVGHLQKAMIEHGFDDYDVDITMALDNLEVALGRPTNGTVLGGLEGALATTELGVPAGAAIVPGCQAPTRAPAYGVADGYLLYVALPVDHGTVDLPGDFGTRKITLEHGFVVVHTAAAAMAGRICGHGDHAALQPPPIQLALLATTATPDPPVVGAARAARPPRLYTEEQAEAGKAVFVANCVTCHGKHMEGGSAPPNAGRTFLSKAGVLGWSVSDMRLLVLSSMPMNNPGSLSPRQYADVLAFLLASDCYPAGKTPFPMNETAKLKAAALKVVASVTPDDPKLGTCSVK